MKIKAWMLCLTAGLVFATTVQAQGPGGRGGPGGFGGFGRGGGGVLMLVGNEAVQKDLGLTEADVAKVKGVTDEFREATREQFANAPRQNFQDMTPEERTAAMEKAREEGKKLNDKFLPKLKAAITADQFTRLQQISWQAMGVGAYSDAEVVKALTITKEQTDKITTLNTEYGAKTRELFQGGGGGPDGFAKMQELNKERDAKINEVLTKAQLDQFATLKGKEFDVTQLRGPGGPGGGRGGPGGGGGGAGARPKRPQPKAE